MTQSKKLTPNLDKKSTKLLNLTVLQRVDPFVEEILFTATHVTFYEFNTNTSEWSRKDVEGPLFVVKRNEYPWFQIVVMNRKNTENLVENLLEDLEYEVQGPYILYRNSFQEVNGIWFYNACECEEVASLFSRIMNTYSKVPTKSKVSPTKSEFEELKAVPSLAVTDGSLELSLSTNTNTTKVPDDPSILNFFSNAMNIGGARNEAISVQPYHPAVSTARPLSFVVPNLPSAHTTSSNSSTNNNNPLMAILDPSGPHTTPKRPTELVKPLSFYAPHLPSPLIMPPPMSPSVPPPRSRTPPVATPQGLSPYIGTTPLLQLFPPPTPTPSPSPDSTLRYGLQIISREKVRDALQILVQDNQFVDMVYRAMVDAHQR